MYKSLLEGEMEENGPGIHASNIIQTARAGFRSKYVYIRHAMTSDEEKAASLKESKENYTEGFEGRKGKGRFMCLRS